MYINEWYQIVKDRYIYLDIAFQIEMIIDNEKLVAYSTITNTHSKDKQAPPLLPERELLSGLHFGGSFRHAFTSVCSRAAKAPASEVTSRPDGSWKNPPSDRTKIPLASELLHYKFEIDSRLLEH